MPAEHPHILIVDDDPDICLVLGDLLQQEGYMVHVASTGAHAIRTVTSQRFDAVILDLGLPDQDGLVVLDLLQKFDPRLPVIVLTAFTIGGKTVESLKRGSFAYLIKPYDREELKAVLARAVGVHALTVKAEQTQAALLESEDRFRAVVQSAAEAIICADAHGNILSWNRAAEQLFGYPGPEILGRPFVSLMPERFRQAHLESLREFERTGRSSVLTRSVEAAALRKDGTERPVELSIGTWETKVGTCYSIIVRDITDRKRYEENLLRQQIEQQVLLDLIPAMVWYKDCNNRIIRANRLAADSISRSVEDVEGRSTSELYPHEADQYYQDDLEVIRTGQPKFGIVEQYPSASGQVRWVQTDKVPYRDPHGTIIGVVVFSQDITARKAAQAALRESQELLAESQRLAHVGSWVLDLSDLEDLNTNELRWSDETYRIFGYEPGMVAVTNDLFFGHVHPDDRPAIVHAVRQALETAGIYEIEHRIVRRDGVERICHEWARVVTDSSGRPVRILGSCQDITERKQAENALRAVQSSDLDFSPARSLRTTP